MTVRMKVWRPIGSRDWHARVYTTGWLGRTVWSQHGYRTKRDALADARKVQRREARKVQRRKTVRAWRRRQTRKARRRVGREVASRNPFATRTVRTRIDPDTGRVTVSHTRGGFPEK